MSIVQFHSKSKNALPPFTPSAMRDLSNFSDFDVVYQGDEYKTVEHAFQALKYSCTERPELVDVVRNATANKDALAAKQSGSKTAMAKHGVTLNVECWNNRKNQIMRELIMSKITRHLEIRQILRVARNNNIHLVHFSRSDMYWGAHVTPDSSGIKKGENQLGRIYMSFYDSSPVVLEESEDSDSIRTFPMEQSRTPLNTHSRTPPMLEESRPMENVKNLMTYPNVPVKMHPPVKRTRQVKSQQVKSQKVCPPGKEINPLTGRCIKTKTQKVCPPGKEINPLTGRCIKTKTQKVCPPGKKINPITGRCIKIK